MLRDATNNGFDTDLTGSSTAQIVGGPEGVSNGAMQKTGTNRLIFPEALRQAIQTASRTLCFWAKGTDGVWYIEEHVPAPTDSGGWGILYLSGSICAQARNTSSLVRSGTVAPTDGEWHHYAATYDATGQTLKFYLDGVNANTDALVPPIRTDTSTLLGPEWSSSATLLSDIRFYDEAITDFASIINPSEPTATEAYIRQGNAWIATQLRVRKDGTWQ